MQRNSSASAILSIADNRIDKDPPHPPLERSLVTETSDLQKDRNEAVVQQILCDLPIAHIAETHAIHLRRVFLIQLLLCSRVILTTAFYQLFFGHLLTGL